MADRCANTAFTGILYLCEEAVFQRTPCFKSSNCSGEAIPRSSWLIRYCLEKLNQGHTPPPNYCNPAAHARRGLMRWIEFYDITHSVGGMNTVSYGSQERLLHDNGCSSRH